MSKKILIVDDERTLAMQLDIRLKHAGYEVRIAVDAMQAVQTAFDWLPDLILLDLNMPAGGGERVVEALSNSSKTMNTAILILSANADLTRKEKIEANLAVRGFIQKPYDSQSILKQIQDILN